VLKTIKGQEKNGTYLKIMKIKSIIKCMEIVGVLSESMGKKPSMLMVLALEIKKHNLIFCLGRAWP